MDYWYRRIGNKNYSNRLEKYLLEKINHQSYFPELGKKDEKTDSRKLVIEDYEIYYSIIENDIQILHIWDTRRNPDNLIIQKNIFLLLEWYIR